MTKASIKLATNSRGGLTLIAAFILMSAAAGTCAAAGATQRSHVAVPRPPAFRLDAAASGLFAFDAQGASEGSFQADVSRHVELATVLPGERELTSSAAAKRYLLDDDFHHGGGPFDHDREHMPAVPEPETYVLLLAGLGLVACVGRRRARGVAAANA